MNTSSISAGWAEQRARSLRGQRRVAIGVRPRFGPARPPRRRAADSRLKSPIAQLMQAETNCINKNGMTCMYQPKPPGDASFIAMVNAWSASAGVWGVNAVPMHTHNRARVARHLRAAAVVDRCIEKEAVHTTACMF
jgi:hypothetical protein